MPANRRVVITGVGAVSSVGIGKDAFWKSLLAGRSGISEVTRFNTSRFPTSRAGEIKNFDPIHFMPASVARRIGRGSQFAIAATQLALEDGRLDVKKAREERVAFIVGTTMGEAPSIELADRYWVEKGEEEIYLSNVRNFPANNLSDNVGSFFGFESFNCLIPTACAAGNYSIGYAFDFIRSGKYDVILAGGADPLSRLAFTGFNRLFAMAPEKCQPFDKNRKGMMLGEGGAMLIIEELEHAKDRCAPIYAEVLGYGLSCDAFNMTIPNERGIVKVMERAVRNSGIGKDDVGYISAHGTGTAQNDKTETLAIKTVFKDSSAGLMMSSIKSMLGHTMGTASAFEAIVCCQVLREGMIPPTINYETPDPDCDLSCTPNTAVRKDVRVALNNSFAFGGNNACVVLRRYENRL